MHKDPEPRHVNLAAKTLFSACLLTYLIPLKMPYQHEPAHCGMVFVSRVAGLPDKLSAVFTYNSDTTRKKKEYIRV